MIIKGAVCIPDIPDSVGDVLSEQQIREAFLFFQRTSKLIDVQHTLQPAAKLLESYIIESETEFNNTTYPKGSWFISCEIFDSEIEQAIADGEYTGFSIFATPKRSVDEMRRPMKQLPKDLKFSQVSSWKPVSVSIVDMPSQKLATFEVYDSDNEFIRKWNPNNPNLMEEQDMEEKVDMNKVSVSESFFEKILGIGKSKPMPPEPTENTEKVEPADKNKKLDALEEKLDKILELVSPKEEDGPAGEGTPAGVRKYIEIDGVKYFPEEGEADHSEEEETNIVSEAPGISRSIDIDLLQTNPEEDLSLMERIGRTPSGCKKINKRW